MNHFRFTIALLGLFSLIHLKFANAQENSDPKTFETRYFWQKTPGGTDDCWKVTFLSEKTEQHQKELVTDSKKEDEREGCAKAERSPTYSWRMENGESKCMQIIYQKGNAFAEEKALPQAGKKRECQDLRPLNLKAIVDKTAEKCYLVDNKTQGKEFKELISMDGTSPAADMNACLDEDEKADSPFCPIPTSFMKWVANATEAITSAKEQLTSSNH
jgi:hypothetical protein